MVEQAKPSTPDAIQCSLKDGYQNLQWWWRQLLELFPNQALLKQTAIDSNSTDFRKANVPVSSFGISTSIMLAPPDSFFNRINYAISVRKLTDEAFTLLIHPHPDDCTPRSWVRQHSSGLVYVKNDLIPPPNHPYCQISAQTTSDLSELRMLTIKHNGLDKTEPLRTTTISLSPTAKRVRYIAQTATDETYFPRSNPRQTKHKPHQLFEVSTRENGQVDYRFNYLVSIYNQQRIVAETTSQRVSYLPHHPIDLPKAILNSCSFTPAVSI